MKILLLIGFLLLTYAQSDLGLFSTDGTRLQLVGLSSQAWIEGPYAAVDHTEIYSNNLGSDINGKFVFFKASSTVLRSFFATIGNGNVTLVVVDKSLGEQGLGNSSSLVNTDASSGSVSIDLGLIPNGYNVSLTYSIIEAITPVASQYLAFSLFNSFDARYDFYNSRWNESLDLSATPFNNSLINTWDINITLAAGYNWTDVVNPFYNLTAVYSRSNGKSLANFVSTINATNDFVLYFQNSRFNETQMVLGRHPLYPKDWVSYLSFVPLFNNLTSADIGNGISNAYTIGELNDLSWPSDQSSAVGEYYFILDYTRTVSQADFAKITTEVQHILQDLLPKNGLFNLIAYGDVVYYFRNFSLPNNAFNVAAAVRWMNKLTQPKGVVSPYYAIQFAHNISVDPLHPRSVFLFLASTPRSTDNIYSLLTVDSAQARFCPIAVGSGASADYINQISSIGHCAATFVASDASSLAADVDPLFKSQVSNFINGVTTNFTCSTNGSVAQSGKLNPSNFSYIFKNKAYSSFIFLPNLPQNSSCNFNIQYYNSYLFTTYTKWWNQTGFPNYELTDIWHKLSYTALTGQLYPIAQSSNNSALQDQILNDSLKYQVYSPAVEWISVIVPPVVSAANANVTVPSQPAPVESEAVEAQPPIVVEAVSGNETLPVNTTSPVESPVESQPVEAAPPIQPNGGSQLPPANVSAPVEAEAGEEFSPIIVQAVSGNEASPISPTPTENVEAQPPVGPTPPVVQNPSANQTAVPTEAAAPSENAETGESQPIIAPAVSGNEASPENAEAPAATSAGAGNENNESAQGSQAGANNTESVVITNTTNVETSTTESTTPSIIQIPLKKGNNRGSGR